MIDSRPYPVPHHPDCAEARVMVLDDVLPDVLYVKCGTCRESTWHLRERYRVRTRLTLEVLSVQHLVRAEKARRR